MPILCTRKPYGVEMDAYGHTIKFNPKRWAIANSGGNITITDPAGVVQVAGVASTEFVDSGDGTAFAVDAVALKADFESDPVVPPAEYEEIVFGSKMLRVDESTGSLSLYKNIGDSWVKQTEFGSVITDRFVSNEPMGGFRYLDEDGTEYHIARMSPTGDGLSATLGNYDARTWLVSDHTGAWMGQVDSKDVQETLVNQGVTGTFSSDVFRHRIQIGQPSVIKGLKVTIPMAAADKTYLCRHSITTTTGKILTELIPDAEWQLVKNSPADYALTDGVAVEVKAGDTVIDLKAALPFPIAADSEGFVDGILSWEFSEAIELPALDADTIKGAQYHTLGSVDRIAGRGWAESLPAIIYVDDSNAVSVTNDTLALITSTSEISAVMITVGTNNIDNMARIGHSAVFGTDDVRLIDAGSHTARLPTEEELLLVAGSQAAESLAGAGNAYDGNSRSSYSMGDASSGARAVVFEYPSPRVMRGISYYVERDDLKQYSGCYLHVLSGGKWFKVLDNYTTAIGSGFLDKVLKADLSEINGLQGKTSLIAMNKDGSERKEIASQNDDKITIFGEKISRASSGALGEAVALVGSTDLLFDDHVGKHITTTNGTITVSSNTLSVGDHFYIQNITGLLGEVVYDFTSYGNVYMHDGSSVEIGEIATKTFKPTGNRVYLVNRYGPDSVQIVPYGGASSGGANAGAMQYEQLVSAGNISGSFSPSAKVAASLDFTATATAKYEVSFRLPIVDTDASVTYYPKFSVNGTPAADSKHQMTAAPFNASRYILTDTMWLDLDAGDVVEFFLQTSGAPVFTILGSSSGAGVRFLWKQLP